MYNKIFCILLTQILILPIGSVCGTSQNFNPVDFNVTTQFVDLSIIDMINQVNKSMIFTYLENFTNFGPKPVGTENCKKAGEYIFNEFKKMGLDVYFDYWKFISFKDRNIVATLNGTDLNSDTVFIICAHYDTVKKSPGANDDGSGIAAMLTIAKIMSQYSFNHTVRFIALSGHEVGTYGSFAYVKKAYARNENIACVLNLDMIGNTTDGKIHIYKFGRTEWISQFTLEILEKYNEYIDIAVETIYGIPWMDETSFLDYGYDGVLFYQGHGWLPEFHNHSPGDNISTINFSILANVTNLILAITAELANKPIDIQIRIVKPCEGYFHISDYFQFKLPGFNLYNIKMLSRNRGMTYIRGGFTTSVNISTETEEEIDVIYLTIDNIYWFVINNTKPPYEMKIDRSFFMCRHINGKHTLGVLVTTSSGKTAYDEMEIFIVSLI